MLVITRKTNEEIRIGHDIVIKVISNGSGRVKLGIEAPAHVRVNRGEVAQRYESEPEFAPCQSEARIAEPELAVV